jgi:hypothetical protein
LRSYITPDAFEIIESDDQRARFRLFTLPTEGVRPEITAGRSKRRADLAAAIKAQETGAPRWRRTLKTSTARPRLPKSPDAALPEREPFAVGDWVMWAPCEYPQADASKDAEAGSGKALARQAVRCVGQVWSMAPGAGSWWVTTDRSATSGEVHLMHRRKLWNGTYSFTIGGSQVVSVGAAGAAEDMLTLRDGIGQKPARPVSYAEWQPPKGSDLAPVREPVDVFRSELLLPVWGRGEVRHAPHVEVIADGLTFVVVASRTNRGEATYRPHLVTPGDEVVMAFPEVDALPVAVDRCLSYTREVRAAARREAEKGEASWVSFGGAAWGSAYRGRYLVPEWSEVGTCPECDNESIPLLSVVRLPDKQAFPAACSLCVGMKHRAQSDELLSAARRRHAAGFQAGLGSLVTAARRSVRAWAMTEHGADRETASRFAWWYGANPRDDFPVAWTNWKKERAASA